MYLTHNIGSASALPIITAVLSACAPCNITAVLSDWLHKNRLFVIKFFMFVYLQILSSSSWPYIWLSMSIRQNAFEREKILLFLFLAFFFSSPCPRFSAQPSPLLTFFSSSQFVQKSEKKTIHWPWPTASDRLRSLRLTFRCYSRCDQEQCPEKKNTQRSRLGEDHDQRQLL